MSRAISRHHIKAEAVTLIPTDPSGQLDVSGIRGYHFPDGPYVEFEGVVPEEQRESMVSQIQGLLGKLVAEESDAMARFDDAENLRVADVYMPAKIPAGKPQDARSYTVADPAESGALTF